MTDPVDRVRAIAALLPEVEERVADGQPTFFVADVPFARLRDDARGNANGVLQVRTGGEDERATLIEGNPARYSQAADAAEWVAMNLVDDADWTLVEDRVARSWELAAPARLLEAGGR